MLEVAEQKREQDGYALTHAAPEQEVPDLTPCSEVLLEAVKQKGKQKVTSKSQKKSRKRLIAQIECVLDSLDQPDEHGNECMASAWRRSGLLLQLDELGHLDVW